MILGFAGPSGVGKTYLRRSITHFLSDQGISYRIPRVVTTRPRRRDDGDDRENVPISVFVDLYARGEIFAVHQPFGPQGHWYGFRLQDFSENEVVVTEIHVDNIARFMEIFPQSLYLIGLSASIAYIKHNLLVRHGTIDAEIKRRLQYTFYERKKLLTFFVQRRIYSLVWLTNALKLRQPIKLGRLWLATKQTVVDSGISITLKALREAGIDL